MTTVPSSAYRQFAEGKITREELEELEKMASVLKDPDLRRTLAVIGASTLMAPALTALGAGAVNKTMSAVDKLTMRRDLRKILAVHPSLGEPEDPHVIMAYQTLRTLNPEYAKDPLIAGPLLQQMLQSRMIPGDPRSAPRMDPGVAGQLIATREKGSKGHPLAGAVGQSLATGATEALKAVSAASSAQEKATAERAAILRGEELDKKDREELRALQHVYAGAHPIPMSPSDLRNMQLGEEEENLREMQKKRRRGF